MNKIFNGQYSLDWQGNADTPSSQPTGNVQVEDAKGIKIRSEEFFAMVQRIQVATDEHEALCAVANAAEELRQEQTSLDMSGERPTERERMEAKHFYENAVGVAQAKLDDAIEKLNELRAKAKKP